MWKQGQKPPVLEFLGYPADGDVCVSKALGKYSLRILEWRKTDNQTQLLLGQIKARKELADIDLETFKFHSTRAASTSTANAIGFTLGSAVDRTVIFFWNYLRARIAHKVIFYE